jgi:hypothetical protein
MAAMEKLFGRACASFLAAFAFRLKLTLSPCMLCISADREIEPLSMNDEGYMNEEGKFVRGEVTHCLLR